MSKIDRILRKFRRESEKLTRTFAGTIRELKATYPEIQFGVMDSSAEGRAIANVTLPTIEKFDRKTGQRIPEELLDRERRHDLATYRLTISADRVEGAKELNKDVAELAQRHGLSPMPEPVSPVPKTNFFSAFFG